MQGLAYGDQTTEPHAADVCQVSQVDDQTSESFGNASSAMLFELRGVLGVHAAADNKHYLICYLPSLDIHSSRYFRTSIFTI